MAEPSRMPNYDVRNDGIGPYAVFYCETCSREHRSQPDVKATVTKDVGRQAMGGLLRKVPLLGDVVADNVVGEDPRYSYSLTPQQVDKAWDQVKDRFRECPTCLRVVCLSDWDEQGGYCTEDSPSRIEIAEAEAEQAGAMLKGFAGALGLGGAFKQVEQAARQATAGTARCPKDGTFAAPGTKFCPECGGLMVQPASDACPKCGKETPGPSSAPNAGARSKERLPASALPAVLRPRAPSSAPSAGPSKARAHSPGRQA